jgi:hypothetical protein
VVSGRSRASQRDQIVRNVAKLADELDVPKIAGSNISRPGSYRADRAVRLSARWRTGKPRLSLGINRIVGVGRCSSKIITKTLEDGTRAAYAKKASLR